MLYTTFDINSAFQPPKNQALEKIDAHLAMINLKKQEFQGKYPEAYQAIDRLHSQIKEQFDYYKKGTITLDDLKTHAKTIIQNDYTRLEQFRGLKLKKIGALIVNLLSLILSLGTSYLLSGQFSWFTVKTDSCKKVDALESAIKALPPRIKDRDLQTY